jgi:tetratricopeptide (TPR) repeat protein
VSAFGANLVLAAALRSSPSTAVLTLQVLNAENQLVLRKVQVLCKSSDLSNLTEIGSKAAEKLLGLPEHDAPLKDQEELQHVSPDVFRLFSEGEQLASEPNNTGLPQAILRYQQAVTSDPHFSLGYAKLAIAYTKQYLDNGEAATLRLAAANASLALRYNPDSATALLSQAMALLYSGKTDDALHYFASSLKADPGNPETLLYKTRAYRNIGKWPEAEQVCRQIVRERPNYWPAYNELGFLLSKQARYPEAAIMFETGATVAPQAALPLANLGTLYYVLGKHDDAIAACNASLKRGPNKAALMALGDIAFGDKNYTAALDYYQRSAVLCPKYHVIWRDIGDCYVVLHQPSLVQANYVKAAQLLTDDLARNPQPGPSWAALAFYNAKIGDAVSAERDIKNADARGDKDIDSQFFIVQALALLGRKEEAFSLLMTCLDRGLSPLAVDFAPDLKGLQKDPRYIAWIARKQSKPGPKSS